MADLIDRDAALARIDCCLGNSLGGRKEFDSGLMQARKFVISTPAVNRWISCSERLPNDRERVLVCFRSGTVHIAVWYGDYDEKGAWKVTSQFPTKLYRTDTIPKWMPLPEPPEKE